MNTLLLILLAAVAIVLLVWIIKGLFSGPKKRKPPAGNESSWSNNAIRKQGKEGKGIR